MSGKEQKKAERALYIDGGYGNLKRLVRKYRIQAGAMIPANTNEMDPRKIEASAKILTDEDILEKTCFTSTPRKLIERVEEYRAAGFNHIIFGDWGYNPGSTVKLFGRVVIPYFKKRK